MDHLAIDVGGRESQTCLRSGDGKIVQEARLATRSLPNLFRQLSPSRVVMETCAESLWLADAATAAGHDVRVVPATLAPMLGVGARGIKNDRRDAQALSEASCRIDLLNLSIRESERELERCAKQEPVAKALMTVPGVGPMTAVCFVATLDTRERFASAHHVQAYLGLTPGERSSSDRQRRTGITKAGSRRMRWLLVQAAWAARRSRRARSSPLVQWSLQVEKRRGKGVAVVGLARKLAGLLFAMWRDGTLYDAKCAAREVDMTTP